MGAGVWVWGPNTVPLACMPCGGCVPRGWWGAVPGGGWPANVVRGVWCQALSLPRPPVLWSGQPGFRDSCVQGVVGAGVGIHNRPHSVRPCGPALLAVGVAEGRPRGGCLPPWGGASGVRRCPSPGRPSSGAGSQGSATSVSRLQSVRAWGPSTGPIACAFAGRRCSLWGWRKGVPGGGAFHHCEGGLRSGAVPPPTAHPLGGLLGSATHVLWALVCGCGGPTLSPLACMPCGGCLPRGWWRASPGEVDCHRCEGRLVSGAVPPPAARALEQAAGFCDSCVQGVVGAGVGSQHRPHSVRLCGPALLAVGVAEGRPRGGMPSTIVRGV